MGVEIILDSMYIFSGGTIDTVTQGLIDNELWKFDITCGSEGAWHLLQADSNSTDRPHGATQSYFNLRRPKTTEIELFAGAYFVSIPEPPFISAVVNEDVWTYEARTNKWTHHDNKNKPVPAREVGARFAITEDLSIFQGGDAQGNLTVEQICLPPLQCFIPATPTNDTYIYNFNQEKFHFLQLEESKLPPLRRPTMVLMGDSLFLYGGEDFQGTNGVGVVPNGDVWELDLGPLKSALKIFESLSEISA
jgi:hypothetical protein